jgi:mRNA-degrading endonuclease RelE of RelBE toxin-antitoxin system
MGTYYVYVPKCVRKSIKKFPEDKRLKIAEKLRELETNPYLGIHMQGKYSHKRKIVLRPYRIVYFVNESKKVIEVEEIESRGNMSYDR